MTSITPKQTQSRYSSKILKRAERAARCTPFQLALFATMRRESVDLRAIAGKAGIQNGYSKQALPEMTVDNLLLWMIQVGLLRREVDGQGLTNRFRLTPLGHQLVERWQQQGDTLPPATLRDRLYNSLSRWFRLPSWLRPF